MSDLVRYELVVGRREAEQKGLLFVGLDIRFGRPPVAEDVG